MVAPVSTKYSVLSNWSLTYRSLLLLVDDSLPESHLVSLNPCPVFG